MNSSSSSASDATPAGGAALIFSHSDATGGDSHRVGIGYGLAIAVGILVLATTILLATYVCLKLQSRSLRRSIRYPPPAAAASAAALTVLTGNSGAAPGLDEATLQTYPKLSFDPSAPPNGSGGGSGGPPTCAICLADYRSLDSLRLLPDCRHFYHSACIDAWLRLHATCPLCRSSPLTTPASTPLSELIPLARHQQITVSYTTVF